MIKFTYDSDDYFVRGGEERQLFVGEETTTDP